jgi:hypothetical protein
MARCQACQGLGFRYAQAFGPHQVLGQPCQVCGGSGWEHCCEGDREQPSALDNPKSYERRRSCGM